MKIFKRDQSKDDRDMKVNTWRATIGTDGSVYPVVKDSSGDMFGIEAHRISNEGVVSPSVVCMYIGCNFHEFITLDGWDLIEGDKQT